MSIESALQQLDETLNKLAESIEQGFNTVTDIEAAGARLNPNRLIEVDELPAPKKKRVRRSKTPVASEPIQEENFLEDDDGFKQELSLNGINSILVAKAQSLGPGGSSKILEVIAAHSKNGKGRKVLDVPPGDWQTLVDAVQELA